METFATYFACLSISGFRSDYEGWKLSFTKKLDIEFLFNVLEVTMRDGNETTGANILGMQKSF